MDRAIPAGCRPPHSRASLYAPAWLAFAAIAAACLLLNSFPALYGDDYWALREAADLRLNPAGAGYFPQLKLLLNVTNNDWLLRSLSLFWMGAALFGIERWVALEGFRPSAQRLIVLLFATNPFLWIYAQQIRFYSYFVAATVLALWRFRAWQARPGRREAFWLSFSLVLLCTAHLFGVLCSAAAVASQAWRRLGSRRLFVAAAALGLVVALWAAPVREQVMLIGARLTNMPGTPGPGSRGLSATMALKAPLTFFFFTLGERVYPLWWWITVPALLFAAASFLLGLRQLRQSADLQALVVSLLLALVAVYLVVDPLAPATAVGAAPRHVIFALPAFLLVLGLGAASRRWLAAGVVAGQGAGIACLLLPQWSYAQSDLMDWPNQLRAADAATFIVVDGRADDRVRRYAPPNARLDRKPPGRDGDYARIVIASNDHRLSMVRPLDEMARKLPGEYQLASNITVFPAQLTVYDRTLPARRLAFYPSRLGLPEQDLRLPLRVEPEGWLLEGFMRLDSEQPGIELAANLPPGPFWAASCYRADQGLPNGAPAAVLRFESADASATEVVLRAGVETAAWDAASAPCRLIGQWTKRAHLVGWQSYPGAYRQHRAAIWATLCPGCKTPVSCVEVRSLLESGTFYFWGVFPAPSGEMTREPDAIARK